MCDEVHTRVANIVCQCGIREVGKFTRIRRRVQAAGDVFGCVREPRGLRRAVRGLIRSASRFARVSIDSKCENMCDGKMNNRYGLSFFAC